MALKTRETTRWTLQQKQLFILAADFSPNRAQLMVPKRLKYSQNLRNRC